MRLAVCTAGGLCGPGSLNENQELGCSCLGHVAPVFA